nr:MULTISPECIES: hypothetical protein [unclassified Pseudomonas]
MVGVGIGRVSLLGSRDVIIARLCLLCSTGLAIGLSQTSLIGVTAMRLLGGITGAGLLDRSRIEHTVLVLSGRIIFSEGLGG